MTAARFSAARRKGFTLTEIAIVLGVIGIILGAIWVAAGQVNEKSRVTQAMNAYGAVTQNMTSMLQGGYGVVNSPCASNCSITAAMITSKAIPQYLGTGATASTPWNPTGLMMEWIANSPRTYRLSYYTVTRDGCIGMIQQATNCTPGQPGCPIAIYTKGTQPAAGAYAAPGFTSTYNSNTPMTSALAEAACAANTGATNSLEFDFTQ